MSTRRRSRAGYTLVEVAATVTITATLAAVTLPVVVKQIENAEPNQMAQDLGNIGKGMELFNYNVGTTAFPSDLFQLVEPISTSTTTHGELYEGGAFTDGMVADWQGPYITYAVTSLSSAGTLTTAFGGTINQRLRLFNSQEEISFTTGTSSESSTGNPRTAGVTPGWSSADYLALRINGLTFAQFKLVDALIDGPASDSSNGRLRLRTVDDGSGDVVVYYLALPLAR